MSAGRTLPYYAWFYDRYSKAVKDVRFGAGKWPALEALYNWRPARNGIMGKIEAFWMNVRSAQAVRNRKTIVAEEIRQAISSKIESEGEARVLSIACGSAQSVFEAIDGTGNVRVLAIDMDETAIEYSRRMAQKFGIKNVEWRKGNVLSPATISDGFKPNIVEVVGLFDYLSDTAIVGLLKRISRMAANDAVLVTAHVHPNPEMNMLRDIVDWEMTYRSLDEFKRLMCEGGFEQARYITEPHGIFTVAVGHTYIAPEKA